MPILSMRSFLAVLKTPRSEDDGDLDDGDLDEVYDYLLFAFDSQ
jgi:hypothetical protein